MVHPTRQSRPRSGHQDNVIDRGQGESLLETDSLLSEQINQVPRDDIECKLEFAGFLVFHCPLKADAVDTLRMLADSSHRVGHTLV